MSDKLKDYIVIVTFALIIFGTLLINTVTPDSAVSKSERKSLQQFPELSIKTIVDKSFMNKFETYTSDQFVGRDAYRRLKANVVFNIFRHSDNNDIYIAEGQASKYISKTNDAAIDNIIK